METTILAPLALMEVHLRSSSHVTLGTLVY